MQAQSPGVSVDVKRPWQNQMQKDHWYYEVDFSFLYIMYQSKELIQYLYAGGRYVWAVLES